MRLTAEQRDHLCQLAGVPPTTDDATLGDALCEALAETREHDPTAFGHQTPPATGTKAGAGSGLTRGHAPVAGGPTLDDPVAWGVQTGRFTEARAATFWRAEAEAERRETGSTARTEAAIRALAPVYGDTGPAAGYAAPASDTPMLDALEARLYGPSPEDRERAEDLAAERALHAQLDHEVTDQQREARRSRLLAQHRDYSARVAAELDDDGLTEAEERALFGPAEPPRQQTGLPEEVYSIRPGGMTRKA